MLIYIDNYKYPRNKSVFSSGNNINTEKKVIGVTKIPQKTHCIFLLNQNNVLPPIRMRSEFAVLLKIRTKLSCQFDKQYTTIHFLIAI